MPAVRKLDFCPFCGSRPVLKVRSDFGEKQYRVLCVRELCPVRPFTRYFDSEGLALLNWNDRHRDSSEKKKNLFWSKRQELKEILHDHERVCRSGQKKLQLNRVIVVLRELKDIWDDRRTRV